MDIEKLAEDLTSLNVKELKQLTDVLKNKYGLEATQPIAAVVTVEPEVVKVEEKTEFDVELVSVSEETKDRLASVKIVNRITEIGLKESMALVKSAPVILKEKVSKIEAEGIKAELEALNAKIVLK